ncbi:14233_t:CDS:2 [Funneliformis caledonium]|uniref:14233_t:CDS:1 n=1 Tax=Funneliformis caledonium TaxID=1117310 RepID=A0A9N9BTV1_9GLOM|nr:14233_t:CDS:2 [Funneliformis caledonium]
MIKKSSLRRKNSLKESLQEQWDKTSKVNVKEQFYSKTPGKYTEVQKAKFTKWVNIQLRSLEEAIAELTPVVTKSFLFDKPKKSIPQIKAIDEDFRDGKKLIELLEILYEDDKDLPKLERGKTRLHYIQNVNKVLEFLQKKLDDGGLIALKAIGSVDIVDGNIKLTLGLIWLIISKFIQMTSNIFEVTEEELNQVEEGFKEDVVKESELTSDGEREINSAAFEEFRSQFRKNFVKDSGSDEKIFDLPSIINEEPEEIIHEEDESIEIPIRDRILSNSNNRLSLPPNYYDGKKEGKKFNPNSPARFRTLRLNPSSPSPMSSSSGLLFWINMQLIDYASILPSTCYPIEDFTGMNDGIMLVALIHHLNMEWIDFDSLVNDDDKREETSDQEFRIKERLTKCFDVLNERLNIRQPKALVSMLIEKDYSDQERLKRTGLAWSVYISEIFLSTAHAKNKQKQVRRQNDRTSPSNRGSMATSNLPPLPPWSPKVSLFSAVWDWTLSWIHDKDDNDDNYDSDDYDKNGKLKEKEMRTITRGNSSRRQQNKLDIQNADEWKSRRDESLDEDPLQLLANTHQPALYMYWS